MEEDIALELGLTGLDALIYTVGLIGTGVVVLAVGYYILKLFVK